MRRIQSQGSRSLRLASSHASPHGTWGPRLRHRRSCDRSRSCWTSIPGTDLFASLAGLFRFDPPRVYRHAAASRCIRLDIRKANRGRRCRTVCKCDLQTRLASCTPGHVCYDKKRRLLPVGSGSSVLRYLQFSSQVFDVWIGRYPCGRVACI